MSDILKTSFLSRVQTHSVIISSNAIKKTHFRVIITISHTRNLTHFPPTHIHTETIESGFVYALTSALAVHQITKACSAGDLGSVCGCDTTRNGLETPQGWTWGSCSDNVSYGIVYAQNFLDARELNKTNSRHESVVAAGEVHLHNNGAGRRVSVC